MEVKKEDQLTPVEVSNVPSNSPQETSKQPLPHELLLEQRFQLRKILEENRQKVCEEDAFQYTTLEQSTSVIVSRELEPLEFLSTIPEPLRNAESSNSSHTSLATLQPMQHPSPIKLLHKQIKCDSEHAEEHQFLVPSLHQLQYNDSESLPPANVFGINSNNKIFLHQSSTPIHVPSYESEHNASSPINIDHTIETPQKDYTKIESGPSNVHSDEQSVSTVVESPTSTDVTCTTQSKGNSGTAVDHPSLSFTSPANHYSCESTSVSEVCQSQLTSSVSAIENYSHASASPHRDAVENSDATCGTQHADDDTACSSVDNVIVVGPDALAIPIKNCRGSARGSKKNKKIIQPGEPILHCEWGDCCETFLVPTLFYCHVEIHLSQYGKNFLGYLSTHARINIILSEHESIKPSK